ncbi:MAG: RNA polymerase sigma factor [Eubacteriales bacterium]
MDQELTELLTSQLERLYRFAYNRLHDEFAAEDLTQDIVECAIRSYHRIADPDRRVPWLWGIARNVYLRTLNAASRRETPAEDVVMIIDSAGVSYETPETVLIHRGEIENLRRAVSYLSKMYRDVCVMYWLEEKDYKSIAEELGIPLSSVKWRLNQSKVRLKEEILKMEYMENGYRKAVKLKFGMGGWDGQMDPAVGNYDGADRALEPLLAQNICLSAYNQPKTVTEIASELGCAAEYIEDTVAGLVKTQCLMQKKDRYQTAFPIWDKAAMEDIYLGSIRCAEADADGILDGIEARADEIRAVGFIGADRPVEKLLLVLLGILSRETDGDFFDSENLPFKGVDKAWFIQAVLEDAWINRFGVGVSSSGVRNGEVLQCYFRSPYTKDMRAYSDAQFEKFYRLYNGEKIEDDYTTSQLLESGKIRKAAGGYEIAVPVISHERGEYAGLMEALAPILERTNSVQKKLNERTREMVTRYIPDHIASQRKFFATFCAHGAWETAVFARLVDRGVKITQDMAMYYIVK